jgi:O-methyltransferase involved in polyketide biosynthesis
MAGPQVGGRRRLELTGEKETLVIPLYAKALDFRSPHSILHDRWANELVRRFDYDFEKLRSAGGRLLVARARQFDVWAEEFLAREPRACVLNLGCGLDSRVSRVSPSADTLWFDVDFPEVIEIRREFFSERPGYRMLGSSINDAGWLQEVPGDRRVLVVADGVLEYLSQDEVRTLLLRLTERFSHGQIVFDTMSSSALARGNTTLRGKTSARLRWAVDDLRELDALNPRLRRTDALPLLGSRFLPWRLRLVYGLAHLSPRMWTVMRAVRYEF